MLYRRSETVVLGKRLDFQTQTVACALFVVWSRFDANLAFGRGTWDAPFSLLGFVPRCERQLGGLRARPGPGCLWPIPKVHAF